MQSIDCLISYQQNQGTLLLKKWQILNLENLLNRQQKKIQNSEVIRPRYYLRYPFLNDKIILEVFKENSMPKIVDPEFEKNNIILAFERCCQSTPITSVTVRAIAKEAGISHSKIFSYFSSKDEIIASYAKYIADIYSRSFEGVVKKAIFKTDDKKELLQSIISELYEVDQQNTVEKLYAQIYVLGQYNEDMYRVVLDAYSDWRQSLTHMLQSIYPNIEDSFARSILVLVEGILIYRMNDALSKEEAQQIITDLFIPNPDIVNN